jgi:hypothetical protein
VRHWLAIKLSAAIERQRIFENILNEKIYQKPSNTYFSWTNLFMSCQKPQNTRETQYSCFCASLLCNFLSGHFIDSTQKLTKKFKMPSPCTLFQLLVTKINED